MIEEYLEIPSLALTVYLLFRFMRIEKSIEDLRKQHEQEIKEIKAKCKIWC